MAATKEEAPEGRLARGASTVATLAELTIYVAVSACLVVGASALLIDTVRNYATHVGDGALVASTELLSALLLVFVFVELLGATRIVIRERRLIAEPFLLVGIIAAIKEIVVVAGAEDVKSGGYETFRDAMVEIGVLAAVILVLSISALLLRRREREPDEERHADA